MVGIKRFLVFLVAAAVIGALAGCLRPEPMTAPTGDPGEELPAVAIDYEPVGDELTWVQSRLSEAGVFVKRFGDDRLVLVTMGEKPTGGYSVTVDEASYTGEVWLIRVIFAAPEPGAMVTQALSYPWTLVKIRDLAGSVVALDISGPEPVELKVTVEE